MSGPHTIELEGLYDDKALGRLLGLRPGSLARARKAGELRFTRRGGQILYFGRWVTAWLAADESCLVAAGSTVRAES